jgi:hypothetical protein
LRTKVIQRLVNWAHKDEHDLLPFLYIHGVQMNGLTTPVAGGSAADVFRGSYQGYDVAIKRFRLFLREEETSKLSKVTFGLNTLPSTVLMLHGSVFVAKL